MKASLAPLLQVQRDLYAIPRGRERFAAYIETMTGGTEESVLPLSRMNPMGKDHCPAALDALIALGAENVASGVLSIAERRLAAVTDEVRVALVLTDDALGGWTDRNFTDAQHRLEPSYDVDHGWAVVLLWTSEQYSAGSIKKEVLTALYRTLHVRRHRREGRRRASPTLAAAMMQEGRASAFAGEPARFDAAGIDAARRIIEPHLESTSFPIVFAALYGDEAARAAGYDPLGLGVRAGFEVALADALANGVAPEEALR
jgi:hypothetical protein